MKQISKEQVLQRIAAENPWWSAPHAIAAPFAEWTPRPYLELLYPLIQDRKTRRAIVLMGPRRVGKTVIAHHAIRALLQDGVDPRCICYLSVDHPVYTGLGLQELLDHYAEATGVDYKSTPCFVFFDEIQYLRDWEVHLKALVDNFWQVKCTASGSAAAALKLKSTESGAGRFTDFLLPPLTFYEYLTLLGKTDLVAIGQDQRAQTFSATDIDELNDHFIRYINYGGYPEVVLNPTMQADPARFIKNDIIDKVLLRDLPSLYGISDIQELNYLFTTLAFNTANEVSLEDLSQRSGVVKNTLKRYIEYLEAAFLIRIVHRVDRNAKRFKRAHCFKVYLTNPSIRTALFQPLTSEDDAIGSSVETAIFAQWFHSDSLLHYARWDKGEVDIVKLKQNQKVSWVVEAKWSDRYFDRPDELKSLIAFCHTKNLTRARVTTRTLSGIKEIESITLDFTPASLYCYILGYNIIRHKKMAITLPELNGSAQQPKE